MSRSATRLGVVFLSWLVAGMALAGDEPPSPAPEALNLRATQVDLAIDREGRHQSFRATVVSVRDDVLTILTAARFVEAGDKGTRSACSSRAGRSGGWCSRSPATRPTSPRIGPRRPAAEGQPVPAGCH